MDLRQSRRDFGMQTIAASLAVGFLQTRSRSMSLSRCAIGSLTEVAETFRKLADSRLNSDSDNCFKR
jgi:hypothetical protein